MPTYSNKLDMDHNDASSMVGYTSEKQRKASTVHVPHPNGQHDSARITYPHTLGPGCLVQALKVLVSSYTGSTQMVLISK